MSVKQARDAQKGDRVLTEVGVGVVEKVIHNTPNFPEIRIVFEGAIAQTARLDYLPTETIKITE